MGEYTTAWIRLPKEVWDGVKSEAKRENRKYTNMAEVLLRESLAARGYLKDDQRAEG